MNVCESHSHEARNGLANNSIRTIIQFSYQGSIRACVHSLFNLCWNVAKLSTIKMHNYPFLSI